MTSAADVWFTSAEIEGIARERGASASHATILKAMKRGDLGEVRARPGRQIGGGRRPLQARAGAVLRWVDGRVVPPGWLTTGEAAKRSGYSRAWLLDLAHRGELESRVIAGVRWFDPEPLDAYVRAADGFKDGRHE